MKRNKILAFLACCFLVVTVIAQEKVYLPYFEVINMNKQYSLSASRLFKLYVEQADKYQVVLPEKFDSLAPAPVFDKIKVTSEQLKTPYFCIGEINRLGEMAVVVINLYKTQDGSKVWTGTLKALEPEDLDPVMNRLATGLNNKTPVSDNEDIFNVTNYDENELNKVTSTGYFGIEVGGAAFLLSDVGNTFPAGFGILLTKDIRNIIVDLKGEFYFGDIDMYGLSININFPLANRKNTPFISSGIGYNGTSIFKDTEMIDWAGNLFISKQTESNAGLTLYLGGGYLFNRNADVNIRINPSLFFSAYKINKQYPAGLILNAAILF